MFPGEPLTVCLVARSWVAWPLACAARVCLPVCRWPRMYEPREAFVLHPPIRVKPPYICGSKLGWGRLHTHADIQSGSNWWRPISDRSSRGFRKICGEDWMFQENQGLILQNLKRHLGWKLCGPAHSNSGIAARQIKASDERIIKTGY